MGCRRVVGIDGSFLKGQCKGQLLTTIGRDPNNHVFPIAWDVVDIDNKFNWKWFLQLLEVGLGMDAGRGMCVVSDQHKGLLEATKEVLPYVEHRKCARHIYANFRKVYSGIQSRNLFWKAAKSTVEGEFKNHMDEIRQISPGAYEHLMVREPNTWCMAFFSIGLACEAVENGIAECFNAVILDARKKPLLTMLEEIRLYMMDRFWRVHPSGKNEFEVRNGLESYGVNIEKRSCACRLWDVSGIPCVHAQASIMLTHQDPKTFISKWFGTAMYISSYSSNILPVNGNNLWSKATYIKPLPPLERRMLGKPIVKRKRHVSERDDKFSQVCSKGRTIQCQNCQQKGYNKKSYMDYITQQIKELRKSCYTDVDIMRCLGITKAHLEEFGYVVDWKEVDRVMKKKKDMDKEMKWKDVEMDKAIKKKKKKKDMEDGGDEGDGQEEDVEGDGEGDEVEGVEAEDVQGNDEGGEGVEVESENVQGNEEGVPVQQGHFGNHMQQRTRRPSKRIILQKLKKKVVDPFGIGMYEDKALVID
ncbi:unnamed protein product [Lactuca saligna]|uniref:SWIM-type domain-containing protein n=1 Tax=Lactuca saligna TaxID=75948 RepID=A0AA36EK16_LACSI|nr:unnamed protein product [Lactuca saligna]